MKRYPFIKFPSYTFPIQDTLNQYIFFSKTFHSYKWTRSIFFYDADGQRNVAGQHTCYLMMTSLGKQMRNENMTFAQYRITEKLKNRTEEMTREIGNKNSGK